MEFKNSAIELYNDLDYTAGGVFDIDKIKDISSFTNELSQNEFSNEYGYCLCTLYGILGCYLDNVGELTMNDRYELSRLRYKMDDFKPTVGGYIYRGVDLVRDYTKKKNKAITTLSIPAGSNNFYKLLDKGYRLNIGMYIKEGYLDGSNDGILEIKEIGDEILYGHSLSIKKMGDNYLVDNYKGLRKYNTFILKDLEEMIKEGIIFKNAYLIYNPERDMEKEIKDNIKLDRARKAFDMKIWNGLNGDKPATREEVAAMIYSIYEKIELN